MTSILWTYRVVMNQRLQVSVTDLFVGLFLLKLLSWMNTVTKAAMEFFSPSFFYFTVILISLL